MTVLDPARIRAEAELNLGPLAASPATWGVLPEGIVVESAQRNRYRLTRAEPCLFLGPPARSKLLLAAAILDASETSTDPVRAYVNVAVAELAGVWVSGLEDAVLRFPPGAVARSRPAPVALVSGAVVWRVGEALPERLADATPAFVVGQERDGARRRALVLVRGANKLEPVYSDEATPRTS